MQVFKTNLEEKEMTKPGRFIAEARKKMVDEGDTDEKFRVIYILRQYYGLHGLTGEAVAIPRTGWARFPDVFVKACEPQIAILLHGAVHMEDSWKEMKMHEDYKSAGVQVIVIWEALGGYSSESIIKALDEAGLKKIKTE